MAGEKPGFVNVDELMRQVSLEQAAAYYGVPLPEIGSGVVQLSEPPSLTVTLPVGVPPPGGVTATA